MGVGGGYPDPLIDIFNVPPKNFMIIFINSSEWLCYRLNDNFYDIE